jgi:hypothetical protein
MRETLDGTNDRSLVLSHLLTNFLQNLASCHTALRQFECQKFLLCKSDRLNNLFDW